MRGLLQSFEIQTRVIGALIMRELHTRYGRENIGFAWFIGEPIVFTFGVVVLWSYIRSSSEHGVGLVPFVLTGYTPLVMWRHCFSQSVNSLKANGSLLYHRNVTLLDVLFARMLLEIAGSMLAFTLAVVVFSLLGYTTPPQGDILLVLLGWILSAWFAVSTAILVAPLTEFSPVAERFAPILGYVMVPLCGAFWMVDWLPAGIRSYALLLPSVSAYEIIRDGYFGSKVTTYYNPGWACLVCAIMSFAGLVLMRRARHVLTVE